MQDKYPLKRLSAKRGAPPVNRRIFGKYLRLLDLLNSTAKGTSLIALAS